MRFPCLDEYKAKVLLKVSELLSMFFLFYIIGAAELPFFSLDLFYWGISCRINF